MHSLPSGHLELGMMPSCAIYSEQGIINLFKIDLSV